MKIFVLVVCVLFGMTAVAFPQTVEECGSGVGLSWDANTDPDIKEYLVYAAPQVTQEYRVVATVAHDPEKIVTLPDGTKEIQGGMAKIPDGLTEFYVTAKDVNENESSPSNHLVCNVQIPPDTPTGLKVTIQLSNP